MTLALPAATLDPEAALALVDPDRRNFALLLADGKEKPASMMTLCDISSATYYRWAKDEAVLTYVDAVGRDAGKRGKRQLRNHIDTAVATIVELMTAEGVPHIVRLNAAKELLDRAGVTKEEITRSGAGGGDTVVQVNVSMPFNPDAYDEQVERRRRRMMAQEATFVESDDQ